VDGRLIVILSKEQENAPRLQISYSSDARVILVPAPKTDAEPRFQIGYDISSQQLFGLDINNWKPAETIRLQDSVAGSPLRSISDIPAGSYTVQAVLNVYETFRRSDGHTLELHRDHGEGQQWNRSPGNLYSLPQRIDLRSDSVVTIDLTAVIPPILPAQDTKYIRHVTLESKLLSRFWDRPVQLGASVLVPEGFDDHPDQHYPVVFLQSHFDGFPFAFRETAAGKDDIGYRFYQDWTSGRLPRMLIVVTQHPTPYFDDSYGVNSANMGPYGDALTQELYPYLEQRFRAIARPWARVLIGPSTGGWMSLAQQIFYPNYFGGAWGLCPDPVDFHALQMEDLYADTNAYYDEGPFLRVPKLFGRLPNDHVLATVEQFKSQEFALGTHGRSARQFDAWQATFSPVGPDGYPAQLWDLQTGKIDPVVAKYWTEHYDLTAPSAARLGGYRAETSRQAARHDGNQRLLLPGCSRASDARFSGKHQTAGQRTLLRRQFRIWNRRAALLYGQNTGRNAALHLLFAHLC
jgi:hypothetical protein